MDNSGAGVTLLIMAVAFLLNVVAYWRLFQKAGRPGWACLIPIYNMVVMQEIIGKPLWWILMLLIPGINLIFVIVFCIGLAQSFGKDLDFAVGLVFLGFIFVPILAFGDAQYIGPDGIIHNS